MIFGIKHIVKHEQGLKREALFNKINRGLKDNSLIKMFVNGYLKRFGETTLFKIEPLVNFNPFWVGVIWFAIFIIFNSQSVWIYLGLVPILISFAWTKYFWYFLVIKSFRKHKIKGKISILSDQELLEFLAKRC